MLPMACWDLQQGFKVLSHSIEFPNYMTLRPYSRSRSCASGRFWDPKQSKENPKSVETPFGVNRQAPVERSLVLDRIQHNRCTKLSNRKEETVHAQQSTSELRRCNLANILSLVNYAQIPPLIHDRPTTGIVAVVRPCPTPNINFAAAHCPGVWATISITVPWVQC